MIRFYCDQCGKSLRASIEIAGRKIRCTACQAKMTVPAESTRKSGENRQQRKVTSQPTVNDKEILSVLADSDSFESFEDFDFSSLKIDSHLKTSKPVELSTSAVPTLQQQVKKTATGNPSPAVFGSSGKSSVASTISSTFSQKFTQRSVDPMRLLQFLACLVGLIALLGIGYFGLQQLMGSSGANDPTELERSATGQHYAQLLRDLRKAERVMYMLEEGYLSRKLPESGLTEVRELRNQVKEIVDNQTSLAEANKLYRSGDEEGAKKVIREEKRRMTELTDLINKKNDWLTSKVYAR